jgi:RimJ/RimL family protein N-acetyltransferase
VGNDASVRVLEKLGFREEGTLRDYLHLRGGFHSCRFFSLLATDARRPAVTKAATGLDPL